MKILLVGNYEQKQQQSMSRFADMMLRLLTEAGEEVQLIRPEPAFARVRARSSALRKVLGQLDRYVWFRRRLGRMAAEADVVHILDHSNAMYVPWLSGKANVVTCHDMLGFRRALGELTVRRLGRASRLQQRWALRGLRRAQRIVCVSEQTRREVIGVGGVATEGTAVVSNALNYAYAPMDPAQARSRIEQMGIAPSDRYVLHVGGNQWYKNRAGVLRIFRELVREPGLEDLRLVLAGKEWTASMEAYIAEAGLSGRLIGRHDVPNEDLQALYSGAQALIFPSLAEGFGWPIIEAQACGCPVFTSDREPMNEIAGEGAVYFDPEDEAAAASVIATGLRDGDKLRTLGARNAERYSEAAMVRGYLEAYRSVLEVEEESAVLRQEHA